MGPALCFPGSPPSSPDPHESVFKGDPIPLVQLLLRKRPQAAGRVP